ncbi:MAG: response regulator transcription factor [Gordonia sp. (in: high G+C Gram-positive bacteria)]|uniref:LuxR C-terminal-related transcriptional regulator n=1 Tax=Gordonia sp. (in: high G+C Gram-positive bacteria) TaxID=84139 RepID=UPI0039E58FCE
MTTAPPAADRQNRCIGVVEDHPVIVDGLRATLTAHSHLRIVASSSTVDALLSGLAAEATTTRLDLVVLDLHGLPDGSTPAANIAALHAAGIANVLVYTYGERRDLVQEAARAGALAVIRKTERSDVVADAIRRAADGESVASMDWAAAIDADAEFRPRLSPRESEVLELYASGETAPRVADLLQVKEYTVREYIKRVKEKYAAVGRPVYTKFDLRTVAREDGIL